MRIKPRLEKLELISGGCSACAGPPGPGTPFEIVVGRVDPDNPQPTPDPKRCSCCGHPTAYRIQVRGRPVSQPRLRGV